jgi:hypothetical protein
VATHCTELESRSCSPTVWSRSCARELLNALAGRRGVDLVSIETSFVQMFQHTDSSNTIVADRALANRIPAITA